MTSNFVIQPNRTCRNRSNATLQCGDADNSSAIFWRRRLGRSIGPARARGDVESLGLEPRSRSVKKPIRLAAVTTTLAIAVTAGIAGASSAPKDHQHDVSPAADAAILVLPDLPKSNWREDLRERANGNPDMKICEHADGSVTVTVFKRLAPGTQPNPNAGPFVAPKGPVCE